MLLSLCILFQFFVLIIVFENKSTMCLVCLNHNVCLKSTVMQYVYNMAMLANAAIAAVTGLDTVLKYVGSFCA